ncbi:MAG: sugar phosphate isomerase/epimerase [Clostridia bacterium]|nr:sugar phosphate isomerase/epimerase [Clostridia bacterium]
MSMDKLKVGLSCHFTDRTPAEVFGSCQEAGISAMELSPLYNSNGIEYAKDVFSSLDLMEIKKLSIKTGVELWSYHLPFCDEEINPAILQATIRRQTIELDKMIIEKVANIGVKVVVIHGSGEPIEAEKRADSLKYATESIYEINEKAKEYGVVLAVENLPRTCLGRDSDEILKLTESDQNIKICFDVNHLLTQSHREFVKNVGHKIATLHISDYDFIDECHLPPGRGKIDWAELVGLLKDIGYNGPFMNEVSGVVVGPDKNKGLITFEELKKINDRVLGCV